LPPYIVNGKNKGVAYEVTIGDIKQERTDVIYVTHPLEYKEFEFYVDKEGYSPLIILRDKEGRELYGAYIALQSIVQEDGTYLYTSGSAVAPGSFHFPQGPQFEPVFSLQMAYQPDEEDKRSGEVSFQAWTYEPSPWAEQHEGQELVKGKALLGERIEAGDYFISMEEVRYWASMKVIYRPGLMIIYSSFWLGLGGLTLSIIMKMARERKY
jgi:hypothetical protein